MEERSPFERSAGLRESKTNFELFDRLSEKLQVRIDDIRERTLVLESGKRGKADVFGKEKDALLDYIAQARESLDRLRELNSTKPIIGDDVNVADIAGTHIFWA